MPHRAALDIRPDEIGEIGLLFAAAITR